MWANDFPHSDSTWPWSQKLLAEHTADMPDEQRDVDPRVERGRAVQHRHLRTRARVSTKTRRTQAERVEASDRALIDAAIELIAERGYDRTTLAAIGEAAGYSRGLVTQRFGNKENLLWAILRQILDRWGTHAMQPRVADRVGVPALQTILAAYLDACESGPKRIRAYYALLREADGPVPAIRDTIKKLHTSERNSIAEFIRAGQAAGTVRADADPDAEATVFLGVMRGVTMQWLLDPKGVDLVGALTQYGATLDKSLGVHR